LQEPRVRVGNSQRDVSSGMNISHRGSPQEASMTRRRVIGRTGMRIALASRSGYWTANEDRKRQPSYFRNGSSPAGRTGRPSSWLDWMRGCYCCTMKRTSNEASICCGQQSRQGWMRFSAFQPRSNRPLRRLAPKRLTKTGLVDVGEPRSLGTDRCTPSQALSIPGSFPSIADLENANSWKSQHEAVTKAQYIPSGSKSNKRD
jgi:hypothetical protein